MNSIKMLAAACGTALLVVTPAVAQPSRSRTFTQPEPPPREALDRLNLVQGWRTYIPMEGRRDGFASIQPDRDRLFVQTRSGLVAAVDANTGQVVWRTRAGRSYQPALPLAFNRKSVFYLNGTYLFALDRTTGAVLWQFSVPGGVSAAPLADDYQIYLGAGTGRLSAYVLPLTGPRTNGTQPAEAAPGQTAVGAERERAERERTAESGSRGALGAGSPGSLGKTVAASFGPQPFLRWESVSGLRLELTPLSSRDEVSFIDPSGVFLGMTKFPENTDSLTELYRLRLTAGAVAVSPGQYEETGYVGSRDANLYAVDLRTGLEVWRYTAGSAITRRPVATGRDVFVTSEQGGLTRIERATGEAAWRVPSGPRGATDGNLLATRFLAANPKFVYAGDDSGRLLVLDYQRGTLLSSYACSHDFVFPVVNDVDDRVLLAANNGLLISLHDRDYPAPYYHRRVDRKGTNPKIAAIEDKLAVLVTDKAGGQAVPLAELLKDFSKTYGLTFTVAENAFKEAGSPGIDKRLVSLPRVIDVPLAEVLRRVLAQVNATFNIDNGQLVITPLPKR